MKILVLGPSDMVHLQRFVRSLADRGHDVHVISMKPDRVAGATFERFKVPSLSVRHPYRWRGRWAAYVRDWFRRFDVVNVHFVSDWGIGSEAAGEGCLVVKAYGSDVDRPPDAPEPDPRLMEARKLLLRCADKVVTSGHWFRQKVADFADLEMDRVEAIHDGVDLELFAPPADRLPHAPVVGFSKGFDPVYGPLAMIESAAGVLLRRPDVRFEFVGAGSLRDACHQRAEALGISHAIRWIGRQHPEAMPRIMSRWDVVAIPSRKESFCVSALEAAAMELPVVATAVGGLCETVEHEETGLLVEPQNPRAFGDALLTLLADSERCRRMGVRGRRRVADRYQWSQSVDRWIELFESVGQSKWSRAMVGQGA